MKTTHTTEFKRVALTLLVMLTMTFSASATDFITDVMVLGHNTSVQVQNLELFTYTVQGWTVINHNLNSGCTSGDFIHLLYRKQSSMGSSGAPITDFYILAGNSSNAPNQLTHEGRTYTIVPYDGSDNFINSKGDLNRGAGGAYIHLYYTKDPMPTYQSVTGITFNSTQSGGVGANGDNTTGYDLNKGAGGDYIYMHVTTQLNANVVMLSSSSGEILLHDGEILTGTGGGDTHVSIAENATVTLSGANITNITNNNSHKWAGLTCLGDAVIVLAEGTTNNLMGGSFCSGLHIPQGHTLTLQGSGTLDATGDANAAGIGSNAVSGSTACGNITINSGTVTAHGGGFGAGIGSGYNQSSCGDITISGGTVNAHGNTNSAGIGCGGGTATCGNITISGGTVNAYGGYFAAAIGGGGSSSSCGNITITNGVTRVTATKGKSCHNSIGASNSGSCGTITIGSVETGFITQSPFVTFPYTVAFNANGGEGTMSDQSFMYNVAQNLNANTFTNEGLWFFGWATSANGPKVYDDGQSVSNLADTIATVNLYAKWRMHFIMLTSSTGEVLLQNGDTLGGTGGGDTHVSIVENATVTLSGANITSIPHDFSHVWAGLSCLGDAVIVLDEGTNNNITGGYRSPGIHVPEGHTLTLQGSGTVTATGGACAAGIGSGFNSSSCGHITINGGNVTANGGTGAAGIGSGYYFSSCGNITLSGGTITAHGGVYSPGIGCGDFCSSCGNITITNGVTRVTAIKGTDCDNAIGESSAGYIGTITIGGVETGNITQSPFVTFPYTVGFNANGGTGTMSDQSFMYNVAQNLHANTFTHGSLSFLGWATSAEGPKVYDDGQSVSNLADTIATVPLYAKWGNPTFTLDIEGYDYVSNPGGWYLIASPVVEAIAPSADNGFLTNEYDLYYFNQSTVGEEWRNYKDNNFLLTNGTGYLYASEIGTTLTFTGTPYTGNGEIELAYNSFVPDFSGVNLVGNPYPETAYVDRDFYVLNSERSEVVPSTEGTVEPMEGIFVIADYDGQTVSFSPTSKETHLGERIVLNLSRDNGTVIDRAIVSFDEGQQLPKFMLNPSHTKVFIPMDGKDYAIANASEMDEMPVCFKAQENGSYTLGFNAQEVELSYLHLIDNLTGNDIDLLETPNYSFEARTTDYSSRFRLVFSADNSDSDSNFAFISSGNIIVNGEGTLQVIDVLGRTIVTRRDGACTVSTDAMAPGVYVLRLIDGDNIKTQKIVIE